MDLQKNYSDIPPTVYRMTNHYYIQNAVIVAPQKKRINWRLGATRISLIIGILGLIVYPWCWVMGFDSNVHLACFLAILIGCWGCLNVSVSSV